MSSHFLLPALFAGVLLALPTSAEASCSGMPPGSAEFARCQQADSEMRRRSFEAHQKSILFQVSVGKHSQEINLYDYKMTGVCQLTQRDGVHTLEPVGLFPDSGPPFGRYGSGTVFMRVGCKDGKQHGDEIKYHPHGAIAARHAFKNGERHGRFETFNGSKKLFSSGRYEHGKLRRLSYFWPEGFEERREPSSKDSGLDRTSVWKNGQPYTGIWKYQVTEDQVILYRVKNGLVHGPSEEYHRGVLTARRDYKNGLLVQTPSAP